GAAARIGGCDLPDDAEGKGGGGGIAAPHAGRAVARAGHPAIDADAVDRTRTNYTNRAGAIDSGPAGAPAAHHAEAGAGDRPVDAVAAAGLGAPDADALAPGAVVDAAQARGEAARVGGRDLPHHARAEAGGAIVLTKDRPLPGDVAADRELV